MNAPANLAAQIAGKTIDQLVEMLRQPQDWLPESLAIAKAELQRRGVSYLETEASIQADIQSGIRPTAISVICIISVFGMLSILPLIFSDNARKIGAWYPPLLAFSAVLGAVCIVGFWMMRRWAVFTYTALCVFNQIFMISMGRWNPLTLLIPGILIVIGFKYLDRMR